MNSKITKAAGIYTQEPIDNIFSAGGGAAAVGGTVVMASKGRVGVVQQVLETNWEKHFGKPLPKKAEGMEGLRHLSEATEDCNYVQVVRVVAADAKYPLLSLRRAVDRGVWAAGEDYVVGDIVSSSAGTDLFRVTVNHTSAGEAPTAEAVGENYELFYTFAEGETAAPIASYFDVDAKQYGTEVLNGDDDLMKIIPIDGDPCLNRSLRIERLNETTKRFTMTFLDKNELGEEVVLESHTVGIDPDDTDDMGAPAYIETVFENQSGIFQVDWNDDYTWADALDALRAVESEDLKPTQIAFEGGTNGGEPTTDDWKNAWNLLRNEDVTVQLLFAAGNYDTDVLAHAGSIADFRHCSFDFDAPPYLNREAAVQWVKDAGFNSRHMRCYHAPYKANDPWRGGKTVWGVSGSAVAAKARCNSMFRGATPCVHFSHAGEKRGFIARTGVAPLFPDSELDRDAFYEARINPVVPSSGAGVIIDDNLTMNHLENYTRFGWVNDTLDFIDHIFEEVAHNALHEDDGNTRDLLTDGMKTKLDELVVSGALVPPRNPAIDGNKPYILTVTQLEIDLWSVQWDVCPSGSARRITGQPKLVK